MTLRLSDLGKLVTVEQVQAAAERILDELTGAAEETIEHWTDDEGLHHAPYRKDLRGRMEVLLDGMLEDLADGTPRNLR